MCRNTHMHSVNMQAHRTFVLLMLANSSKCTSFLSLISIQISNVLRRGKFPYTHFKITKISATNEEIFIPLTYATFLAIKIMYMTWNKVIRSKITLCQCLICFLN